MVGSEKRSKSVYCSLSTKAILDERRRPLISRLSHPAAPCFPSLLSLNPSLLPLQERPGTTIRPTPCTAAALLILVANSPLLVPSVEARANTLTFEVIERRLD